MPAPMHPLKGGMKHDDRSAACALLPAVFPVGQGRGGERRAALPVFYPKEYQEEAFRRGLAEKETVARQSKRFMIPFCLVMLAALAAILTFWNRAADFKTALWQAALFLVVMNWFDGIVIDRLWVGRSPVWRIRGMEGIPYVKPWKTVLTRRALGTVVYLILAPAVAGLALLLGRLCA